MRVIAGRFRSRVLKAPKGTETRPTSDRVREGLFSMLRSDGLFAEEDQKLRVLDLYAGSGGLGFEALSRGAETAVFVDARREAAQTIRENARALGVEGSVRIVPSRVERALAQIEGPFDVIFVDPPYELVRSPELASVLATASGLIAPDGAIVLEHASSDAPPDVSSLERGRSRRYGDTTVTLYRLRPS